MSTTGRTIIATVVALVVAAGCDERGTSPPDTADVDPEPVPFSPEQPMGHDAALEHLKAQYERLPEALYSVSADSTLYAQYAGPTDRYRHGILGDAIEASRLVALKDGVPLVLDLDESHVFEDLAPRLHDVDGDGELEIVTIRSHVNRGAGIAIYKVGADGLEEYARVAEIGTANRWLNIAAVYDLDSDGTMELAWVQTPHIGGILKVARVEAGELQVLAESTLYSNHAIGERNLCLSVVTDDGSGPVLSVPTHDRQQIARLRFADDAWVGEDAIDQAVDFSLPLFDQFAFSDVVQGGADCLPGAHP